MELAKKLACLQELVDGANLKNRDTEEAKILVAVMGFLEDIVAEIESAKYHIGEVDEGLADIEEHIFGSEVEGELLEITCPNCQTKTVISEEIFVSDEKVACPNCKEEFELEFDCDCGCEDDECFCSECEEAEEPPKKKKKDKK